MRTLVILLLFIAAPGAATAEPLDFDELAKSTQTAHFGTDELTKVPSDILFGEQPAAKLPGGIYLHAWLECTHHKCKPTLGLYVDGKGGIDAKKETNLPLPFRKPIVGLKYRPIAVVAWNGGLKQALIRYEVYGSPRPGLGSLLWEYLAIVNLPDLSIAFFHEIARGGEATVDSSCEYDVEQVTGQKPGLHLKGTCSGCDLEPKGCKSPRALPAETYRWQAKTRRYLR